MRWPPGPIRQRRDAGRRDCDPGASQHSVWAIVFGLGWNRMGWRYDLVLARGDPDIRFNHFSDSPVSLGMSVKGNELRRLEREREDEEREDQPRAEHQHEIEQRELWRAECAENFGAAEADFSTAYDALRRLASSELLARVRASFEADRCGGADRRLHEDLSENIPPWIRRNKRQSGRRPKAQPRSR